MKPWRVGLIVLFFAGPASPCRLWAAADLCLGLIPDDKTNRPMDRTVPKPGVGRAAAVTEPQFVNPATPQLAPKIIRITNSGANHAIKSMYTTIPGWNADETRLLLMDIDNWTYMLYDGNTYAKIRDLDDVNAPDEANVLWHLTDPDVFFYVEGTKLIRYGVSAPAGGRKTALHDFSDVCAAHITFQGRTLDRYFGLGDDPVYNWNPNYFSFVCHYGGVDDDNNQNTPDIYPGAHVMIYQADADQVVADQPAGAAVDGSAPKAPRLGADGTAALWSRTVTDIRLNALRTLSIANPDEHTSNGMMANGHDTFNTVIWDPPAGGNDNDYDGFLTTYDLTDGTHRVIIGPKNGYPYPKDPHVSAMATRNPGWVLVSANDDNDPPDGQQLLDLELVLANTNTGDVCRVAHHRSWGKPNPTHGYFAEAHGVISPTGTRILYGSDWDGGNSVDAYVVELPGYGAASDALPPARPRGLRVR